MAIYRNKYTLEFDDVIEGEFNDYKLEINKKVAETTTNNVTVGAINNSGENINQFDPVRVVSGEVVRSKASVSSSMPSTGIATIAIASGGTTPNGILVSGVLEGIPSQVIGYDYYVGINGGTTNTAPTGTNIVQRIAVQVANNSAALLDNQVTLKGTGTPIKLTYNLTNNDILSPFRSSYLDISFYKESLSDDFSELFAAESDAFKVYLYKNDSLFWQGWIGSQLFSEPFSSAPYPITLKAYDGLNLLKDIPYFDNVEVFQANSNLFNDRYGYHNIVDVVEKCIYNTGVLGDIYYCVNVKNSEYVEDSKFFVSRTRVHHQTFLKGESNSMNMEEVLGMVLRSLGATIYQRDGDWCFIKISDFTLTSTPSILKRSVWRADTVPTATNYITTIEGTGSSSKVSNNVDFIKIDGDATMTMQYPLKEVVIEQDFDHNMVTSTTIDSVKDLGADDPSGLYLFTEWEASGNNIQEAVVLRRNEILSEAKNLSKSFIEADLGASGVDMNYCDPYLYYPVSHNCTINSSTITGLKAESKSRPLGRSFVEKEACSVLFSPKLKYTDIGGIIKEYGFGMVAANQTSMINKKTLRLNANAFVGALRLGMLGVRIKTSTSQSQWRVRVTQNKITHFTSQTYTTPSNNISNADYYFGYKNGTYLPTNDPPIILESFSMLEGDYEVFFEIISGNPIANFVWYISGFLTEDVAAAAPQFEFQQWGSNIDFLITSEANMTIDFQYVLRNQLNTPNATAQIDGYTQNSNVFNLKNITGTVEVGDQAQSSGGGTTLEAEDIFVVSTTQSTVTLSASVTLNDNFNIVFRDINIIPREGGNLGTTPPVDGQNDLSVSTFRKTWDCALPPSNYLNDEGFIASQIKTTRINQFIKYSMTGSEGWRSDITNLDISMNIFGSAKTFDTSGESIEFPTDSSGNPITTNPRYDDTFDVSYTDIKLYPLVTSSTFKPLKQEYIISQSGSYSNKIQHKVKIGSGLFNVGSKRYITFNSETGSSAMKSWNTFSDARGFSGYGVEDSTIQHLVAACYMELYRVSVRRLDGTHYGNYKYGDKLQPIVGGSVETLNGSTGKFFPMNVVMDLRNARVSFSGDDLMNNTGTTWQSTLTKSIKWIGDNGITETETLT